MKPLTPPPLPEGPGRELHAALHELHHRAGWPSLRQMARGIGCSHTTLSKVFRSPEVPSWESLDRVVRFLHGDVEHFRTLWYRATGGGDVAPVPAPRPAPRTTARRDLHLVAAPAPPAPQAPSAAPPASQEPPAVPFSSQAPPAAVAEPARVATAAGPAPVPPGATPPSTTAELRRRVTRGLDEPLGSAAHGDIGTQLDRFEERLLALCVRSVLDVLGEPVESAGPGVRLVDAAGRTLAVKLRPDLDRERTLRVVLQDVDRPGPDPDQQRHDSGTIAGSLGRFDAVHLTVPQDLDGCVATELRDHLLVTLGAGYDILERRAGEALASLQTSFDRAVSGHLADALSGPDEPDVWVLLVSRQRVWPAVTPDVVGRVLRRVRTLDDPLTAPVRRAYRVLADPSPLDEPLREALGSGHPVAVRTVAAAPHRRTDLLGLLLPAGTDVSVLPLVVGERISILAATPQPSAERAACALAPFGDVLARLAERY